MGYAQTVRTVSYFASPGTNGRSEKENANRR
jgi:hypothetical protein